MKFQSARGPAKRKRPVALLAAASVAVVCSVAASAVPANSGVTPTGKQSATTLSGMQSTPLAHGAYTVDNDEWGSSAQENITTDGTAGFTVARSAISNATNGAPGGYPSIYSGCHWGSCT
jgi:hypothetical protein